MTILITGSEGNIGSYITKALRSSYPESIIIRTGLNSNPASPLSANDMYLSGDLRDESFVSTLFSQAPIEYIIHAAAKEYNATGFKQSPFDVVDNDSRSLLQVLRNASQCKKIVYLSSATLYEHSDQTPFTEDLTDHIPPPSSPYGAAKLFGERAVSAFHQQFQIPYTIWRMFNVVSPLEPHDHPGGHVFVDFYRALVLEHASELNIFGSGNQVRCFTWVEDIAKNISQHLLNPKTDNQIFNLGGTEPITLRQLAELILSLAKEQSLIPADYQPIINSGQDFYGTDSQVRIPSMNKFNQTLAPYSWTDVRTCFLKYISHKQS